MLVLKKRQRNKRMIGDASLRVSALASPFGQVEMPLEKNIRRRREAFEDRFCCKLLMCASELLLYMYYVLCELVTICGKCCVAGLRAFHAIHVCCCHASGRLAYLGIADSGVQIPMHRQDVLAALHAVPATKALLKKMNKIAGNSSMWTADEAAVVACHFCKAAALGDIASMQSLLHLGASISAAAPPWADSPLHAVCLISCLSHACST
jgi:hypothetical protein